MTACDDREIPATVAIAVSSETLDYELVDVNEVINTNTVLASEGEINLCGSFSLKQPLPLRNSSRRSSTLSSGRSDSCSTGNSRHRPAG